jgi:hypothetical protein
LTIRSSFTQNREDVKFTIRLIEKSTLRLSETIPWEFPLRDVEKAMKLAKDIQGWEKMPNFFDYDITNKALMSESPMSATVIPQLTEIEKTGVCSYITLVSSLWYPYSLVMGPMLFGFDFP